MDQMVIFAGAVVLCGVSVAAKNMFRRMIRAL